MIPHHDYDGEIQISHGEELELNFIIFPIWLLFIYIIFILFIYVIVSKDLPFCHVWRSIPLACIVESSLHMKNIYEVPNIN